MTKRAFAGFYRMHIFCALIVLILGLFHGFGSAVWHGYAPASVPGGFFWVIDLVLRAFFLNCALVCCRPAAKPRCYMLRGCCIGCCRWLCGKLSVASPANRQKLLVCHLWHVCAAALLASNLTPMSAVCCVLRDMWAQCSAGMTATSKAQLRAIKADRSKPAGHVAFSMPNTRKKFTAGQWVFMCIPKLGILHWHPFTISSSGYDQDMTLHFGGTGKWSSAVAALAERGEPVKVWTPALRSLAACRQLCRMLSARGSHMQFTYVNPRLCSHIACRTRWVSCGHTQTMVALQAYIEGPYGTPMIDLHGEHFTCFLIITSGMGWTFLRAWKRQLVQEAARGRPVHALRCVAIMRHHDRHLAKEFAGWDIELPEGAQAPALAAEVCMPNFCSVVKCNMGTAAMVL